MRVAAATTDRAEIETLTQVLARQYEINSVDYGRWADLFTRVFSLTDKRAIQGNQVSRLVYDLTGIDPRPRVRKSNRAIITAKHTTAYVLHHHCKWSTADVAEFLAYSNRSTIVLALAKIPKIAFENMSMADIVAKALETVKCHKRQVSKSESSHPMRK